MGHPFQLAERELEPEMKIRALSFAHLCALFFFDRKSSETMSTWTLDYFKENDFAIRSPDLQKNQDQDL